MWIGLVGGAVAILLVLIVVFLTGGWPSFRRLVVGADNRVSTSQCVALGWTLGFAYMLLAMLIGLWTGKSGAWNHLHLDNPGGEAAYLALLGGPYASHLWARTRAAADTDRTPSDQASVIQLIGDDNNNPDLPDFQYVLFNAIVFLAVLVQFIRFPGRGLPAVSPAVYVLTLASAGTYSINKVVKQAPATAKPAAKPVVVPGGKSRTTYYGPRAVDS